jgi:hypothetical protein
MVEFLSHDGWQFRALMFHVISVLEVMRKSVFPLPQTDFPNILIFITEPTSLTPVINWFSDVRDPVGCECISHTTHAYDKLII